MKNENKFKKGLGQGEGIHYQPWIRTHDQYSTGNKSKTLGLLVKREHHFLSNLERDVFYMIEFQDRVVDIREQFALKNVELAKRIAKEIGVKYPPPVEGDEDFFLTTDFLITVRNDDNSIGYMARTVKPSDVLNDSKKQKRIMEKFEIERLYWKSHNVDFKIYTDQSFSKTKANNLALCRKYASVDSILIDFSREGLMRLDLIEYFERVRFNQRLSDEDMIINLGMSKYNVRNLIKHMIVNKIMTVDLSKKIDYKNLTVVGFDMEKLEKLVEKVG